jgi:hypothetical protein
LPRRQHGALQFLVHVDVALCRGFIFQHMLARVGGVCCFAEYPLPLFKAVKGVLLPLCLQAIHVTFRLHDEALTGWRYGSLKLVNTSHQVSYRKV